MYYLDNTKNMKKSHHREIISRGHDTAELLVKMICNREYGKGQKIEEKIAAPIHLRFLDRI